MIQSYEQTFRVKQYECDIKNRMFPSAIMRHVQEISIDHCNDIGFDKYYYQENGTVFLLSRLSMVIHRIPTLYEKVRLVTRPHGVRRAVYYRLTSLYAENGDLLCEIDSRWVLVDVEARRIIRKCPEEFNNIFNMEPSLNKHNMDMPSFANAEHLALLKARYSYCDSNGHINNTRYADMIYDYLPYDMLREKLPARMLIFYRSEIEAQQDFDLYKGTGENTQDNTLHYFYGTSEGKKNFEVLVEF